MAITVVVAATKAPAWAVRTTLQGPETEPEDHFTLNPRGDAR